jgi:hypothetical protein
MFYVGQEIICIDDSCDDKYVNRSLCGLDIVLIDNLDGLTKGNIYTIRAICFCLYARIDLIWLNEIVRPLDQDNYEMGYHPNRFRPIQKKKTDISIFTSMLKDIKDKELV